MFNLTSQIDGIETREWSCSPLSSLEPSQEPQNDNTEKSTSTETLREETLSDNDKTTTDNFLEKKERIITTKTTTTTETKPIYLAEEEKSEESEEKIWNNWHVNGDIKTFKHAIIQINGKVNDSVSDEFCQLLELLLRTPRNKGGYANYVTFSEFMELMAAMRWKEVESEECWYDVMRGEPSHITRDMPRLHHYVCQYYFTKNTQEQDAKLIAEFTRERLNLIENKSCNVSCQEIDADGGNRHTSHNNNNNNNKLSNDYIAETSVDCEIDLSPTQEECNTLFDNVNDKKDTKNNTRLKEEKVEHAVVKLFDKLETEEAEQKKCKERMPFSIAVEENINQEICRYSIPTLSSLHRCCDIDKNNNKNEKLFCKTNKTVKNFKELINNEKWTEHNKEERDECSKVANASYKIKEKKKFTVFERLYAIAKSEAGECNKESELPKTETTYDCRNMLSQKDEFIIHAKAPWKLSNNKINNKETTFNCACRLTTSQVCASHQHQHLENNKETNFVKQSQHDYHKVPLNKSVDRQAKHEIMNKESSIHSYAELHQSTFDKEKQHKQTVNSDSIHSNEKTNKFTANSIDHNSTHYLIPTASSSARLQCTEEIHYDPLLHTPSTPREHFHPPPQIPRFVPPRYVEAVARLRRAASLHSAKKFEEELRESVDERVEHESTVKQMLQTTPILTLPVVQRGYDEKPLTLNIRLSNAFELDTIVTESIMNR